MSQRDVLVLITDGWGANGGIAAFNAKYINALAGLPMAGAIRVAARRPPAPTDEEKPPAPSVRHLPSPASVPGYALGVVRACLAFPPDAIVCGHINLLPVAVLAKGLARLRGRRALLQLVVHGIDGWAPRRRLLTAAVDRVLAVSQVTRDRFLAWAQVAPTACAVVPNAVDLDRFTPGHRDPVLAERLGLGDRGPVIMTLGRHDARERYKGVETVLAILPALAQRWPGIRYVVAGPGDDLPRLATVARERGVADRVIFTGPLEAADKPGLYRLADAFVLCGHGEGFGIVLLEAMATGVPVVASSRDGSREAVADGALGELADPDDPDSLTAALSRALSASAGRRREGVEAFGVAAFHRRVAALWGSYFIRT